MGGTEIHQGRRNPARAARAYVQDGPRWRPDVPGLCARPRVTRGSRRPLLPDCEHRALDVPRRRCGSMRNAPCPESWLSTAHTLTTRINTGVCALPQVLT